MRREADLHHAWELVTVICYCPSQRLIGPKIRIQASLSQRRRLAGIRSKASIRPDT